MTTKQIKDLSPVASLELADELPISDISDSEITKKATFSQVKAVTSLTASEVKALYESNADTNAFTDADETKLASVESGATANQTDAFLLDRANHTGTQVMATISDAGLLATEDNVNLTYVANPTQGEITNDQGTNAIIPLVSSTNAGLMPPFGYVTDQTESSTTSSTFQNKVTLNFTAIAGTYRFTWYATCTSDDNSENCEVEFTDGVSQLQVMAYTPQRIDTITAGAKTYEINFRQPDGTDTAYIKQVTIIAELIAG